MRSSADPPTARCGADDLTAVARRLLVDRLRDLLGAVDGVSFGDAWPNRVDERIDLEDGRKVPLPVIGLAELVRNERASGRHEDLDDVEHLEPVLARSPKK